MPQPAPPVKKTEQLSHKSVNISAININSITAPDRLQELQDIVDDNDISILALSELKVDSSVHPSLYSLIGFHAPVIKPRTRKGGGVAVYLRDTLPFSQIALLNNEDFEALWVKVKAHKSTIILCSCYLPPHAKADEQAKFLDYLADSVCQAKIFSPDLITVVGDFNAGNCWLPPGAPYSSPVTTFDLNLKSTAETLALTQVIKTATRIQNGTHNLRDLAMVDRPDLVKSATAAPTFSKLDHLPIIVTLSLSTSDNYHNSVTTTVWDFKNTNIEKMIHALSTTNWDEIAQEPIDEGIDLLSSAILHAAENSIPKKTVKVRNNKPWFSAELRREMRKRDRLFRRAKQRGTERDWTNWRNQRNLVTSLNRRLKNDHLRLKVNVLMENKKNPYKYHKILKSITGFNKSVTVPPLIVGDDIVSNDEEKAEAFNEYFSSQTNISISNHHIETLQKYKLVHTKTPYTFCFSPITPNEIVQTINAMDSSKACGPDKIPTKLIKMTTAYVAEPLSKLLNKSVQEGQYPTQWKTATVKPVFKGKGSPSEPESHRPISLLPCLSKIFEKLMFARIYTHLNDHSLLTPRQSGYRPGNNTELQLTYLTDRLYRSLDSKNDYTIVYLDISRYFEKIWHEGLLAKCDAEFGIRGNYLEWLNSYLTNRQQVVQVGHSTSKPQKLAAGVPQGSVLGPLLAIMYLNGLSRVTVNEMLFFADDSSLHTSHNSNNCEDIEKSLQHDLQSIKEYGDDWIITFNASKTSQQTFTQKPKTKIPALTFDGIPIPIKDNHKHLGVTMSSDLRFKSHVNQILLKFNRTLSPLYPIASMLPRQILLKIYNTYVRPHLDYCDAIFDGHLTVADKARLEKAQNRAARLITATPRRTPTAGLLAELGWTSLEIRRRKHKLQLYHKIKFDKSTPTFIADIIPDSRQLESERNLRSTQRNLLTVPMAKSSTFARSFIPATTKLWNEIPNQLRQETSHKLFKKGLSEALGEVSSSPYLSLGHKTGNTLHAKLRLQASDLNEHRYKLGKTDSPKCLCGARREDNHHFLLSCPMFSTERDDMFQQLSAALNLNFQSISQSRKIQIMLYGPERERNADITIAKIVQCFLQRTQRFA